MDNLLIPHRSVLIAGATGAIGRELVCLACLNPLVDRVVALSRRYIPPAEYQAVFGSDLVFDESEECKLIVVQLDWETLWRNGGTITGFNNSQETQLVEAFSNVSIAVNAMGTTKSDAGSAKAFRHCDLDFSTVFAKAVSLYNPVNSVHYALVSAEGASSHSWFLYMKTKGEIEEMTKAFGFRHTSIYRPGMLARKEKTRTMEKMLCCFSTIDVETVAQAIVVASLKLGLRNGDTMWSGTTDICSETDPNPLGEVKSVPHPAVVTIYGNEAISQLAEQYVAPLEE